MFLKCKKGEKHVICIDEASKTEKKEDVIPGNITELTSGNTYTCTIDDSAVTFKPGN